MTNEPFILMELIYVSYFSGFFILQSTKLITVPFPVSLISLFPCFFCYCVHSFLLSWFDKLVFLFPFQCRNVPSILRFPSILITIKSHTINDLSINTSVSQATYSFSPKQTPKHHKKTKEQSQEVQDKVLQIQIHQFWFKYKEHIADFKHLVKWRLNPLFKKQVKNMA